MMPITLPTPEAALTRQISDLAWRAMITEVNLSPKPGLVDRHNCGAHKDMALTDFYRSADAIRPWLSQFIASGNRSAKQPESQVLVALRPIGLACETAMFRATAGVNTHKGSIFSLGLLCAAFGRLQSRHQPITPERLCSTVAAFCQGLTARELQQHNPLQTAGQRLYQQLGLTGARGEAEAGYPLVVNLALPHYQRQLTQGIAPELALLDTLLVLMAHNDDTNVAARGGADGLRWLQQQAKTRLAQGGIRCPADVAHLHTFNQQCIGRNLSPGGSADLLIITQFLSDISIDPLNVNK